MKDYTPHVFIVGARIDSARLGIPGWYIAQAGIGPKKLGMIVR